MVELFINRLNRSNITFLISQQELMLLLLKITFFEHPDNMFELTDRK